MSIFKNNKEEENRVAASEPHVEQESEVLSAEDVKALAPLYDNVVLALKQVYDPEIPVNIYDLGLIYSINVADGGDVHVTMTLTAPGCPVAGEMPGWVMEAVGAVPGVRQANVDLVWDPQWGMDMMSDEARLELGFM